MNVSDHLLEVEVLIDFRGSDADVSSWGEAPICILDVLARDDSAKAGNRHHLGRRKPHLGEEEPGV
jgi:hypothetical protein